MMCYSMCRVWLRCIMSSQDMSTTNTMAGNIATNWPWGDTGWGTVLHIPWYAAHPVPWLMPAPSFQGPFAWLLAPLITNVPCPAFLDGLPGEWPTEWESLLARSRLFLDNRPILGPNPEGNKWERACRNAPKWPTALAGPRPGYKGRKH